MPCEDLRDDVRIAGPEDVLRGEHGDEGLRAGAHEGGVALMPGFVKGEEAMGLERMYMGERGMGITGDRVRSIS